MKYQDSVILVSSQSGVLDFWSMFGPLRPRASFYAPAQLSSTVLALATNQDNDILISGDTAGHIIVWDMREYCNSSLETYVSKAWVTHKRQVSLQQADSPPKQCNWHAHVKSVVSLQVVDNLQEGQFILSASTDCTAKLWAMNGALVGVFGQGCLWNLAERSTQNCTHEKQNEKIEHQLLGSTINDKLRPHTTGEVFSLNSCSKSETSRRPDWRNDDLFGSQRSLTESCILGDKYNKSFEHRMMNRRTRKKNLGHVDTSLTSGGGLGTSCSPFRALHVLTSDEFQLPRDLPMTPRMKTESKLSRGGSWQKHLTSLNFPPISLEDT